LPLHLALAVVVAACMCGLVQIPILLVARLRGSAIASSMAALVRGLCIGSAFFGLALGYRAMRSGPLAFPGGPALLHSLPPYWFARACLVIEGKASPDIYFYLACAAPLAVLLLYTLVASLPQRRPGGQTTRHGRQSPLVTLGKLFCRKTYELGMLQFTLALMARERNFRLLALPVLCLPLGMMLFSSAESGRFFFALMHGLPTAYLPFLLAALPYSDNHQASWLLHTGEGHPLLMSRRGAELAFATLMVPVQLVLFVIDASFRDVMSALPSSLAALALVWLVLPRLVGTIGEASFSQDPRDFRSPPELGGVLVLGFLVVSVGIVLELLSGIAFLSLAVLLLVIAFFVLENHEVTGYSAANEA